MMEALKSSVSMKQLAPGRHSPPLGLPARRQRGHTFRATGSGGPGKTDDTEAEMRLQAIEQLSRKRRKGDVELPDDLRYSGREMAARELQSAAAEWKEGQLFPEGWENMNTFEKFYNAYAGKRGLLFWANKAAYASVFILIGAWIVFRFIGPALGLYKVAD